MVLVAGVINRRRALRPTYCLGAGVINRRRALRPTYCLESLSGRFYFTKGILNMKAHRAFLTTAGLSLTLLVALAAGAALPATQAGPGAAVTVHDSSPAMAATPTSQAVRVLPLITKGWLVWVPDTPTPTPTPTPTLPGGPSEFELEVGRLVNQERAANGLPALAWSSELWCAARGHSVDMATHNCFSHYGCLDNSTVGQRVTGCGYHWTMVGENIAAGYTSPASVVQAWMSSPTHRENILNPGFKDLGAGYAYNSSSTYRHYWTLDLAKRSGQSSAASLSRPEPLAAVSATPTPTASPVPTGDLGWQTVYGTVRSATTSTPLPLPGAVVSYSHFARLGGGSSGSTTTGADGRYSFNPIYLHDTDEVTVRAAATGYAAQEQQRSGLQTWYNPVFDFVLTPWTPTPTPTTGFRLYLPLIIKSWLWPTMCPVDTPEPLWVEPVTSPTDQLAQVVTVRIGHGEAVTVTAESGIFAVTGSFDAYENPALVTVTLQANTTHHLEVFGRVRRVVQNGCPYGGYTLSTNRDRLGAPLTIVQQSGIATPTATPTATPATTPSATPTSTPTATSTPIATSTATPPPLPPNLGVNYLSYAGSHEIIAITNYGGQAQVMTDWKINSVVGDQWYYFPYGYTRAAGATVRIHSGPDAISDPPDDLLWTRAYIWNDAGDKAVLYGSGGQEVHSYCYKAGCP